MPARLSDQDRVYEGIRAKIEAGEWPPGHKLPSGRELAVEYEVSGSTVDIAVKLLIRDGWVEGHQGKGRFVADPLPERR